MQDTSDHRGPQICFQISCWLLGLIAFSQLLIAGVALAKRFEETRIVRVEERVITKLVSTGNGQNPANGANTASALPPPLEEPQRVLPEARDLEAPPIADPDVERLVKEARDARIAEDMGAAIVKLEEAREIDPKDPNVHYEMGLVYETMAAFDASLAQKAASAYQEVYKLGTSGAGALYPLAARKLRDGIAMPTDMRGDLSLGRTRIFKDDAYKDGERVVLTIPVYAAPGYEPDATDFFVKVNFYDKDRSGKIVPKSRDSITIVEWVSGEIDWLSGEEVCRVTYIIPKVSASDLHLFGQRSYYGQVAELMYKNELIDSQAWPRHLASQQQSNGLDPLFLDEELPYDGSLLPPLDDQEW